MRILREFDEWKRLQVLDQRQRSIVFYAEDAKSWVHTGEMIGELTENLGQEICCLTSSEDDPVLRTKNKKIHAFYIGEGTVRTLLFLGLKADVMVMDMPEIENYHIKRSKVYPVHYVYVFHSLASTHMNYRQGAFDHYDTIFCCGPHHVREIRETERVYGLKPKNLVEHGYGKLDSLLRQSAGKGEQKERNGSKIRVLVAPSWGPRGLLETKAEELTEILLNAGFHVTVRPHPETTKRHCGMLSRLREKYDSHPDFALETDVTSQDSLYLSDCLVTAWGGLAFEYAFSLQRPVVFVDVPRKVNNPDYMLIPCEPIEVGLREKIGAVVDPGQLQAMPGIINRLSADTQSMKDRILKVRYETVFNINNSAGVGAEKIKSIADKRCLEPASVS